jgi:hypothetical protein
MMGNIHGPQLAAIHLKGRAGVFYSAEDLSTGLVGVPVDGIFGYEPATATAIMRNLVMSAGLLSGVSATIKSPISQP